jgi:hypothetical protein
MTTEKQKKIQLSKTHQHLGVKEGAIVGSRSTLQQEASERGSKRKR